MIPKGLSTKTLAVVFRVLIILTCVVSIVYIILWSNQHRSIAEHLLSNYASEKWIFYKVMNDNKGKSPNSERDISGANHSRILCIVLTIKRFHDTRAKAVSRTWGRRCDDTIFSTDSYLPGQFNTIYVGLPNSNKALITHRLFRTLRFVYFKLSQGYDWFYVTDDDTYVIVENLRHFLIDKNVTYPRYYGFYYGPTHLKHNSSSLSFAHGGSGMLFNRPTLKALATEGYISSKRGKCHPLLLDYGHDEHADVNLGWCLLKLGVPLGNTTDNQQRQTFLKENPLRILNAPEGAKTDEQRWFGYRDVVKNSKTIYEALSDSSISFHYMSPGDMYFVDFLLYNLKRGHANPQDSFMSGIKQEFSSNELRWHKTVLNGSWLDAGV